MSAAEMALWARIHNLTRADIHSALWKSRNLVKTYCMRGTLHLLPSADLSVYINALKKSRMEAVQRTMSKFVITLRETDKMNIALMDALNAGPMTKRELTKQISPVVGKRLRTWMSHVWNIFRPAIMEGLICYGPDRGKEATFVRTDKWLSKQREISEEEAKQILLRRYMKAYGPATLRDFSKWAGMSTKEARPVWESLKDELVEVHIEDEKGFILQEDYDELRNSHVDDHILCLLPYFDPYMLAHADKNHLVYSHHYKKVYRNQGWISPVILLNGRVIGIWSYTRQGKRLSLQIEPFQKFSKIIRTKIEEEAERLGSFLETSYEVKYKKAEN
jgi:hypothetical protein